MRHSLVLKFTICFLFLFIVNTLSGQHKADSLSDDENNSSGVKLLASRMRQDFIADNKKQTKSDSIDYPVNGRWSDINYKDRASGGWEPGKHWDRIIVMARQYAAAVDDERKLKQHIEQAIGFWLREKPSSGNYWWNAIGAPLKMGQVLIMMEGALSDETKSKILGLMSLGIKPDHYEYYGSATGQNQVWLATVHLMMGVSANDPKIIDRAFHAFHNEIFLSDKEGIQFDYSFHQHGAQLYSGGYGMGYTNEITRLICWSNGTRWHFPPEKISLFSAFILDGQQWLAYKNVFDYSTLGREISRARGADDRVMRLISICEEMGSLDLPRKEEFINVAKRLRGLLPERSLNKHFWRSDFMVHHTPKYYTSIKVASDRLKASESGNGENLRARYLGHGVQLMLRHGKEYQQIFPLWDWQRLPGHLAVQQEQQPTGAGIWGENSQGKRSFTGGVSNGKIGLVVADYEKDSVIAKRSWFCFDDEVVVMGAGINSTSDRSLFQSINQCYQYGPVVINSKSEKKVSHATIRQNTSMKAVDWIHHDSIGYFLLEKKDVNIEAVRKQGSWKDINNTSDSPAGIRERDIFSLAIDLGNKVNDASFSYAIVPAISSDDATKYRMPFRIISNTKVIQAVRNIESKTLMAAFYAASTLDDKADKFQLTVNKGVLVIVSENKNNIILNVSSPANEEGEVVLKINKRLTGPGCVWSDPLKMTTVTIKLPAGGYSGQSVEHTFHINLR